MHFSFQVFPLEHNMFHCLSLRSTGVEGDPLVMTYGALKGRGVERKGNSFRSCHRLPHPLSLYLSLSLSLSLSLPILCNFLSHSHSWFHRTVHFHESLSNLKKSFSFFSPLPRSFCCPFLWILQKYIWFFLCLFLCVCFF